MIQRQCPECGSELVRARLPDYKPRAGIVAAPTTYWRCSTCGAAFTTEQLREKKLAKQLDNAAT